MLSAMIYRVPETHRWEIPTHSFRSVYKKIVRVINPSFEEEYYQEMLTKIQELAREDVDYLLIPLELNM